MSYYVYVLENRHDKSWYTSFTENIKQRLINHNSGRGGNTTKRKGGWKLIYCEIYINKQDAIGREKFLKSGSGKKYLKKQLKNYLKIDPNL